LIKLLKLQSPSETKGLPDLVIKKEYKDGNLQLKNPYTITQLEFTAVIEHSFYIWHKQTYSNYHSQYLPTNFNWPNENKDGSIVSVRC
jgi:hypothetical protein